MIYFFYNERCRQGCLGDHSKLSERSGSQTNNVKRSSRPVSKKAPPVGQRIIKGLEEALAWSKGEDVLKDVRRSIALWPIL